MELMLENQYLRVEISSLGAEIISIYHKPSGRDYLWEGDPAVWGRHSPILFPNCGSSKLGHYQMEGQQYPAKQHGFARDLNHKVVCASEQIATFRLESGPETLERYPYKFALKTTYKLEKNAIVCRHKVINYDARPIYFSFGFHTGIRCPFVPGTSYSDYDVVFEKQEDCARLVSENGCIQREEQRFCPDSKRLPVQKGRFLGSLILKNPSSSYIQLEERKSGDYLRITGTDSPYTVVWAAPEDVRELCIEPWYGVADYTDFTGDFATKEGVNKLESMGEWVCQQRIEIGMGKKQG